jgi:thymidylate kinase
MQVLDVHALGVSSISTNEPPPASGEALGLEAVAAFFQALNQQAVRYCHWKSNLRLEKGLRGQTDLDLLIDRRHSRSLRRILNQHKIKPMLAAPGKRYPAVEDYLGFDPASGQLFHLHVHYQLVLGEQFVKNYRLPLESYFLDTVELRHGVKIPIPELEIIVLSIRALLKYRDRDAFKDILSIRSPGLPAPVRKEIEWLLSQTSPERLRRVMEELADVIPTDVVREFLDVVAVTPRAGVTLYRLRRRVREKLRAYQRDSRWQAILTYFQEARRRRKRLRFSSSPKMTSPTGGLTLAIIGADGAGKSTMCRVLAQWLGWKMDVQVYYLGSKQPSRRSQLAYLLFRLARRSHHTLCRMIDGRNPIARLLESMRQSFLYAHYVFIGQDRYRRSAAGQRRAMDGSLIIFDRYPLDAIAGSLEHHLLDGPQIHRAAPGDTSWLRQRFARAEQNLYGQMRRPDYAFVLKVSPDISLQRKPDHKREAVETKSQTIGELIALAGSGGAKTNLVLIDADQPMDNVIRQLKEKAWDVL